MIEEKTTGKPVIKTIIAMAVIMLFYYIAGAAVIINGLEGTDAKFTQGVFIWISVAAALIFSLIKWRSLRPLGFTKIAEGSLKRLLYFIPVIVIAVSGMIGGVDLAEGGIQFILATLFLTVGVGFSEEIYFRGIICRLWQKQSDTAAIIVSAALFGVCHLLNVLGGAGLFYTIMQVFFAFFYGVVFALIFVVSGSLVPVICLHFFHDFCSFIAKDASLAVQAAQIVFQTVVLVGYMVIIWKRFQEEDRIGRDDDEAV